MNQHMLPHWFTTGRHLGLCIVVAVELALGDQAAAAKACHQETPLPADVRQVGCVKQAIGYTPHHLDFRVLLAVSYSEVGREEEARAEAAALLRLNPHYSVEVDRQRCPYKEPAVLDRHLAALRKAGLQ